MHETAPTVFLIARPSLELEGMRGYLRDVGGESWLTRRLQEAQASPNAGELLVEFAGRACYRSWEPGLNPNVSKVRTDQREYFANILRSAHGSVLEHANYSFALRNVGRPFTHELVRHGDLEVEDLEKAIRADEAHELDRGPGEGGRRAPRSRERAAEE